ncbi:MAG: hypothetical protein ACREDK_06040 [Thermoplasmata archaeon]
MSLIVVLLMALTGVAVGAGKGPMIASAPEIVCNGFGTWTSGNLSLGPSDCQSLFSGQYGAWVPDNGGHWIGAAYNFSYAVPFVTEVDPTGHLVALANFLGPFYGNVTSVSFTQGAIAETDLMATYTTNVTNASGRWDANDSWGGTGPGWTNGSVPIGTASLQLVWHISDDATAAISNGTYRLKLDINLLHWPWTNRSDRLGAQFTGLAPWGSQFAYNASNRTVSEYWNLPNSSTRNGTSGAPAIGPWFFGLEFGANATANYTNGTRSNASVGIDPIFWRGGTINRSAVVLLTFNGPQGNYSNLSYDPLMVFASGGPPGTVGTNPGLGGGGPGRLPPSLPWTVAGVGLVIAVVGVLVFRARRRGSSSCALRRE